ncbi:hypothetical protein NGUA10_03414 [Salmonella enterica]|nr:hypothetical protein NGUA10_03414 [Salmonella enterica]
MIIFYICYSLLLSKTSLMEEPPEALLLGSSSLSLEK